jgi:hypothetical protein
VVLEVAVLEVVVLLFVVPDVEIIDLTPVRTRAALNA